MLVNMLINGFEFFICHIYQQLPTRLPLLLHFMVAIYRPMSPIPFRIISPALGRSMMTSSNGNFFCVTGPLCGEFTGHRLIPCTKGQWRRALMSSLICAWTNGWVNSREAGDLRRHRTHHDVTLMHTIISVAVNNRDEYGKCFTRIYENWQ